MPLSTLNEEQLSAATARMGNNLIIASAGTGKTSTIVGRIGHLLHNGADPSKILLLTFTNKAAGEMLARVGRFFPPNVVKKIEFHFLHLMLLLVLQHLLHFPHQWYTLHIALLLCLHFCHVIQLHVFLSL